jgi:hypothetical protein
MDSIDDRLESFVAWRGEVPPEATRVEDFEARPHVATWVQRHIGNGIAAAYVIGFQHADAWWTYFFDRIDDEHTPQDAERWHVEAYDSQCRSWSEDFRYWPPQARWVRASAPAILIYRVAGDRPVPGHDARADFPQPD